MPQNVLGPNQNTETSNGAQPELRFFNLWPQARDLLEGAAALDGQHITDYGEVAELHMHAELLEEPLVAAAERYPHGLLSIALEEAPATLPDRFIEEDDRGLFRVRLPLVSVTAVKVNPRLYNGPAMYDIAMSAKKALANEGRYTDRHAGGGTCGENHCACALASVDVDRLVAEVSPVLNLRVRTGEEPPLSVFDGQGGTIEEPAPGRWHQLPLVSVVGIGYATARPIRTAEHSPVSHTGS